MDSFGFTLAFGWLPTIVLFSRIGFDFTHLTGRVIPVPLLPIIQIHPNGRGDKTLLLHERTHVQQLWKTAWLHVPLYILSKRYRAKAETEAYVEQIKVTGSRFIQVAAHFMANEYRLGITTTEAKQMIEDRLDGK